MRIYCINLAIKSVTDSQGITIGPIILAFTEEHMRDHNFDILSQNEPNYLRYMNWYKTEIEVVETLGG